ncbi:hypothetical protein [Vibrio europaeus]|uniref:hypothetical protein n=1 Tax=Vibrio europaeus TaxID=300876 RepID=UPI0039E0C9BC
MKVTFLTAAISSFASVSGVNIVNDTVIYSNSEVRFPIYPQNTSVIVEGYDDTFSYSPDRKYILIQKKEVKSFIDQNGNETKSVRNSCDIVLVDTGCVISTNDGEVCGANWVNEHDILTSTGKYYIPITTEQLPPKEMSAELDYSNLEFSLPSYMACYPPSKNNLNDYKEISSKLSSIYGRTNELDPKPNNAPDE